MPNISLAGRIYSAVVTPSRGGQPRHCSGLPERRQGLSGCCRDLPLSTVVSCLSMESAKAREY